MKKFSIKQSTYCIHKPTVVITQQFIIMIPITQSTLSGYSQDIALVYIYIKQLGAYAHANPTVHPSICPWHLSICPLAQPSSHPSAVSIQPTISLSDCPPTHPTFPSVHTRICYQLHPSLQLIHNAYTTNTLVIYHLTYFTSW